MCFTASPHGSKASAREKGYFLLSLLIFFIWAASLTSLIFGIVYIEKPTSKVMGDVITIEHLIDVHNHHGNVVEVEFGFWTNKTSDQNDYILGRETITFFNYKQAEHYHNQYNASRRILIEYRRYKPEKWHWISGERQQTEPWVDTAIGLGVGAFFFLSFVVWWPPVIWFNLRNDRIRNYKNNLAIQRVCELERQSMNNSMMMRSPPPSKPVTFSYHDKDKNRSPSSADNESSSSSYSYTYT